MVGLQWAPRRVDVKDLDSPVEADQDLAEVRLQCIPENGNYDGDAVGAKRTVYFSAGIVGTEDTLLTLKCALLRLSS